MDLSSIDLVVNLAGRPIEKHLDGRALPVEDWEVGDPFGSDLAVYRRIRDEIERRVMDLIERLREAGQQMSRQRKAAERDGFYVVAEATRSTSGPE